MKDFRRQGLTIEEFAALKAKYARAPKVTYDDRLGCGGCGSASSWFFIYADVIICEACKSRYLIQPIFRPAMAGTRKRCRCKGSLWSIFLTKIRCGACGDHEALWAPIFPRPMFEFIDLEETPRHMNAFGQARRIHGLEENHARS